MRNKSSHPPRRRIIPLFPRSSLVNQHANSTSNSSSSTIVLLRDPITVSFNFQICCCIFFYDCFVPFVILYWLSHELIWIMNHKLLCIHHIAVEHETTPSTYEQAVVSTLLLRSSGVAPRTHCPLHHKAIRVPFDGAGGFACSIEHFTRTVQ